MYPISDKNLNIETDEAVFFFTPAFHPLDNFSAHAVDLWGIKFPTAEHAFQWKKFSEVKPEVAKEILKAISPHVVKKISNTNKDKQPQTWHDEKVKIMEQILKAKAKQHEDVREALKRTGSRQIIENSPVDSFWGIGPDKRGQNVVGEIWMKIRDGLVV
ncbi:NADAR family protein [Patescibacteria group bacterium]|nr:NADAR family protein [Patescibacteria group bacterium]